jgi:hypothetical protein
MKKRAPKVQPAIVASRTLREANSKETVEICLFQPCKDPSSEHGDWMCRVEIRRHSGTESIEAGGIDSLQALIMAISTARQALKTSMRSLIWLDKPGELGLPLMIQEEDPDFIALIELSIAAEHGRLLLAAKREGERRHRRTVKKKSSS